MTLPSVGLEQACDDPQLLNFPLRPKQREVVAAMDAGVRLAVLALGRRSGKSVLAGLVLAHDAALRGHLNALVRPGETRYSVAVATNQAQARLVLAAARTILSASPLLSSLIAGETEDTIRLELPDGSRTCIAAFPCNGRGGRGWPISALVLDELAHFISDTDGPAAADKMYRALTPATAQFGDEGRIVAASTPWGTDGLFAGLYTQAAAGELHGAEAFHATTAEANPDIDAAFLAAEEARDPDGFRIEYLAEFLSSGDAYLDFDRFDVAERGELEPAACSGWIAGLDPAFSRDPFGLAVVGRAKETVGILKLGLATSWRPTGEFASAVDRAADVAARFGARISTDQYAAVAIVERLRAKGLTVSSHATTAATKTAMYGQLRAKLYDGSLELYHHPDLIAELRRLRAVYRPGSASVLSPRVGGSHGDIASALALAVYEQRGGLGGRSVYATGARAPTVRRGDLRLVGERYLDRDGDRLIPAPGHQREA